MQRIQKEVQNQIDELPSNIRIPIIRLINDISQRDYENYTKLELEDRLLGYIRDSLRSEENEN